MKPQRHREATADLCELRGLALTPARQAHLASLDLPALEALRTHLKAQRTCLGRAPKLGAWPPS